VVHLTLSEGALLSVSGFKGDEEKSRVLVMFKLFVVVDVNSA